MKPSVFLLISIACILLVHSPLSAQIFSPNKTVLLDLDEKTIYDSIVQTLNDTVITKGNKAVNGVRNASVEFNQECSFYSSFFPEDGSFSFVNFKVGCAVCNTDFMGAVDFSFSKFKEYFLCSDVYIRRKSFFNNSDFMQADILESVFVEEANFTTSEFHNNLDIGRSVFFKGLTFNDATFDKVVSFYGSEIFHFLDLGNIKTSEDAEFDFTGTELPALIDFSYNNKIQEVVDFTTARFDRPDFHIKSFGNWHYINLRNSAVSKIKIDYSHFRLCFYDGIREFNVIVGGNSGRSIALFTEDSLFYKTTSVALKDPDLINKILAIKDFKFYLKRIFPSCRSSDPVLKSFLMYCIYIRCFPSALSNDEINSGYEKVLENFKLNGQKESYQMLDM